MINIINCILAVALALLALLCCMLCYAIGRKNDRLTKLDNERCKLEGEIHRLKNVIEDKDFQLQENDEIIQDLNNKLRSDGSRDKH